MRVTVDTKQVTAAAARHRAATDQLTRRASQVLRKVSLDVEAAIKSTMPVLTGRARASWGHYDAAQLVMANSDSSDSDAVWQESPMEVTQGSAVPYIEALNAGHSRQAPSAFIDTAALHGQDVLEQALAALLEQVIG